MWQELPVPDLLQEALGIDQGITFFLEGLTEFFGPLQDWNLLFGVLDIPV